ncbi:MAG: phenylalanine--tRNA ligase subunit beta [Gammaproteobacteria bacterium]|nr:phenylalanine--tRNA ligase subunit beta [Gammaproteobacteria bacterium]
MKVSEQWLRTWVNPDISTDEMVEQLTMAGLEVDGTEPAAGAFTDVVVARVESVEKHPDADKLSVCQVSDGGETLQIVCGAANVRAGLSVALARVGAVLPAGEDQTFRIKSAKLRGVASAGMLCSEKELGLAEQSEGIMELPADAPAGKTLREYLQLDDTIIDIDLTPNRGDCLSVAGIARELGTLNKCDVTEELHDPYTQDIKDTFEVNIEAPEACSHYAGRVLRNVDVNAPTPVWMVERLRRTGIRSLGAVVDITNYVMIELGQPMHAFDLDQLDGRINVRYAYDSESITLLDGKRLELDTDTLVIADNSRPLALAGIMGGENSGVSEQTRSIFLESAFFARETIAGKARGYGLHTDSSHRFERGVDPQLQVLAIDRATELILEICGGDVGPVTEVTTEAHPKDRQPIDLRYERINRVLGIELEQDEIIEILTRLGMEVKSFKDHWMVKPPSFRFDIEIEADLLEELVRIHGYNNIPRTTPQYHAVMRDMPEGLQPLSQLRRSLVDRGYFEAITYSFVDPKWQAILDPDRQTVELANPLSSEMSVMRTTIWAGLLQSVRHNLNRQQSRVRLFETGQVFLQDDTGLAQLDRISGAVCGPINNEQWGEASREVDFYDLKADVESLFGAEADITCRAEAHPALHPGQSAAVCKNGEAIGWMGALHPQTISALDLSTTVYVFELDLNAVLASHLPSFRPLSKFPEVRRDLAILIDEKISAQSIEDCIRNSSSQILQEVRLFDIYTGKGVDKGLKSVAFGLILQDFSRTLTDQDIDSELESVVNALNQNFAATLRE